MFWSDNQSRPPIGIDIGARRFMAAQLDATGETVAAATALPRTDSSGVPSPEEIRRLWSVLERGGFAGHRVILAAPADKVVGSVLELPKTQALATAQLARMEVARTHKCAPEAMEVGCWELPAAARAGKSVQVMASACRHEDLTPLLDAFESQGFEVEAVDLRSCALARVATKLPKDGDESRKDRAVTAILDLGWTGATLVLLHRDTIVYERRISEGGLQKLHDELLRRLHIDAEIADFLMGLGTRSDEAEQALPPDVDALIANHAESLATELAASFEYAAHQYHDAGVSNLNLCGTGACVNGLDEHLRTHLSVPTAALRPAQVYPELEKRQLQCVSPDLIAALGLAMFPMNALDQNAEQAA